MSRENVNCSRLKSGLLNTDVQFSQKRETISIGKAFRSNASDAVLFQTQMFNTNNQLITGTLNVTAGSSDEMVETEESLNQDLQVNESKHHH